MLAIRTGFLVLVLVSAMRPLFSAAPGDLSAIASPVDGVMPQTSAEAVLLPEGERLHLVFSGIQGENVEIYWRSREGGQWQDPVQLSSAGKRASEHNPAALLDREGRVHVVWQGREGRVALCVRYRRRLVDGSWGEIVSFPVGSRKMLPGIVEDDSGRIYIYYDNANQADAGGKIFVHVSDDGGLTWRDSDPNFSPETRHGRRESAQMIVIPGGVAMAWIDQSPGALATVFSRSLDGGKSWESPQVLSEGRKAFRDVKLIGRGNTIHAVWGLGGRNELGAFQELYAATSTDLGENWEESRLIHSSRGWGLAFELLGWTDEVGFVAVEKQSNRADRLVFGSFWANNRQTEREVSEIWETKSSRGDIQGIRTFSSPDMMGVMFSEQSVASTGAVHASIRTRREAGWKYLPLSSDLEKLNEERGDVNAMGPVGFLQRQGDGVALNYLFHLAKRRRFIQETLPPNTTLVFGRVPLN